MFPVVLPRPVQNLLVWDGEEAAAASRVPALLISSGRPLSDLSRFQELTPQLVKVKLSALDTSSPCSSQSRSTP
jgi:hypothetical protein